MDIGSYWLPVKNYDFINFSYIKMTLFNEINIFIIIIITRTI